MGRGGSARALLGPTGFAFSQACSETRRWTDREGLPGLKAKLGKTRVFFLKLLGWPNELIASDKT